MPTTASGSRRHWWTAGAVTAGVTALAVGAVAMVGGDTVGAFEEGSPPKAPCEGELLETPEDDPRAPLTEVSRNGEYIVETIRNAPSFVLWHDRKPSLVSGPPDSWGTATVTEVNSHGVVVGYSTENTIDRETHVWKYEDDEFQELKPPKSSGSVRNGVINDNGTIIGQESDVGPVKWEAGEPKGTRLDLDVDSDMAAAVSDMSTDGTMLGQQFEEMEDDIYREPAVWAADGTQRHIPVADLQFGSGKSLAGSWVLFDGGEETYRWNLGADREPEIIDTIQATAIDENGRVYGSHYVDEKARPSVLGDQLLPLPAPDGVDPPRERPETTVSAASADGSVVTGLWNDEPVVWTCG